MKGCGGKFKSRVAICVALMVFISILNLYKGVLLDFTVKKKVGNYIALQLRANGFYSVESNFDINIRSNRSFTVQLSDKCNKSFEFKQQRVFENFYGFDGRFAILNNAVLHPTSGHGRVGGEKIADVQNQSETAEYWTFDAGFLTVQCQSSVKYKFKKNIFSTKWMDVLKCRNGTDNNLHNSCPSTWTIAITRTDYANLYISMIDLYNMFSMVNHLNINVNDLTVLWIDGHPKGALDDTWTSLFGRVVRVGALKQPTLFNNLIWCPKDPLPGKKPNSMEEFRAFFLKRHNLSPEHKLNCSKLNITFVWRHDYLAHPRRMSGFVERKIKNEDELIVAAKSTFSSHHVTGVQLDTLDMTGQLGLVSTTDIFVGMHGAGLTHTMFLPRTSALLELFPYRRTLLSHMHEIAQARSLHYAYWRNNDKKNDIGKGYTHVIVKDVMDKIKGLSSSLCSTG